MDCSFEGLEVTDAWITRHCARIAYLRLYDRTVRDDEEAVGKFEFSAEGAREAVTGVATAAGGDDDGPADPVDGEPDDGEADDGPPSLPASGSIAPPVLARAARWWLRTTASGNLTPVDRYRRFRLRVYGPKGLDTLHTATFIARNLDLDGELVAQAPEFPQFASPGPSPAPASAPDSGFGVAFPALRALADGYQAFLGMCLQVFGQQNQINASALNRMLRENSEYRETLQQLFAQVLDSKRQMLEIEAAQALESRQGDVRAVLGQEAIRQTADLAKSLFGAHLPQELRELGEVLTANPEVVALMRDPQMMALLRDRQRMREVAPVLRMYAASTVPGAAPPPPPPPETPPAAEPMAVAS